MRKFNNRRMDILGPSDDTRWKVKDMNKTTHYLLLIYIFKA